MPSRYSTAFNFISDATETQPFTHISRNISKLSAEAILSTDISDIRLTQTKLRWCFLSKKWLRAVNWCLYASFCCGSQKFCII
jgi:hypothetical protein